MIPPSRDRQPLPDDWNVVKQDPPAKRKRGRPLGSTSKNKRRAPATLAVEMAIEQVTKPELLKHYRTVVTEAVSKVHDLSYSASTRESVATSVADLVQFIANHHNEALTTDDKYWRDPKYVAFLESNNKATWGISTRHTHLKNLLMFVKLIRKAYEGRIPAKYEDDLAVVENRFRVEKRTIEQRVDHINDDLKTNYVPLAQLEHKFDTVVKPAFDSLVASGNLNLENQHHRDIHDDALVFAMNMLEPPCRSVCSDCAIVDSPAQLRGNNSIYIPTSGPALLHVAKDDHVREGKIPPKTYELRAETSQMLRQSLRIWPRLYLFCAKASAGDEPMSKPEYQATVKHAFRIGDRAPGVQTIRKIVVVNFWFRNGMNLKATMWLADRMRHTLKTVLDTYFKIGSSITSQIPDGPYDMRASAPPVPMPDATSWMPTDDLNDEDSNDVPAAHPAAPPPVLQAPAAPPRPPMPGGANTFVLRGTGGGSSSRADAARVTRHNSKETPPYQVRKLLKAYNERGVIPEPATVRAKRLYQDDKGTWRSEIVDEKDALQKK